MPPLASTLRSLTDAVMPLSEDRNIVLSGIVVSLMLIATPFEMWVKPWAREFRIDNPHINWPMKKEHVPVPLLVFLVFLMPMLFIIASAFFGKRFRRHATLSVLGFLLAISSTFAVVDIAKCLIGNERPDFIARCQPKAGVAHDVYVTVEAVCTNPDWATVIEGCKSTPSGHTSLSFAGLGFLSIWLFMTFKLTSPNKPLWAKALATAPIFLAAWIGYTRIQDHKHHWCDVISGAIVGSTMAFVAYVKGVGESQPSGPERAFETA